MRHIVVANDLDHISGAYGKLQGNDMKAEVAVVARVLRTGSHAARQHRNRVADMVKQLFEHTPPDDVEMWYVKETVFGATGGNLESRTIYG